MRKSALGFTHVLSNVIILRGGMSERVYVEYLYDANPTYGWNTELDFSDAGWSEGKTPIGMREDIYFLRTKVPFNNLYARKVFSVDKIPQSAILWVASEDGVEVWVNGYNVLSDINARHLASY